MNKIEKNFIYICRISNNNDKVTTITQKLTVESRLCKFVFH